MRAAFSNIGWARHDDPQELAALRGAGVEGIEVAPTKVWPGWNGANVAAARAYASRLGDLGFCVPAMQAILFGKPELRLFDREPSGRQALLDHVRRVAELAEGLGAKALVYGAPKSRLRGELSPEDAESIAAETFAALGAICAERGTCLCIEPNPAEYGCDFVTDAASALRLVERVNHPGFGLHLDAAALHMASDSLESLIVAGRPWLRHYHISEPFLGGFDAPQVPHASFLAILAEHGYDGFVSVEVDGQKHDLDRTLRFLSNLMASPR